MNAPTRPCTRPSLRGPRLPQKSALPNPGFTAQQDERTRPRGPQLVQLVLEQPQLSISANQLIGGFGRATRNGGSNRPAGARRLLRRRSSETLILTEYPLLQSSQASGWVDTEFLAQQIAEATVYVQRFSGPAAAVQGGHQECPGCLSQRVSGAEVLQTRHCVQVTACGK